MLPIGFVSIVDCVDFDGELYDYVVECVCVVAANSIQKILTILVGDFRANFGILVGDFSPYFGYACRFWWKLLLIRGCNFFFLKLQVLKSELL